MHIVIRCLGIAGFISLALAVSAPAQALNYSEPPDLTSNLALPDHVGTLDVGENTVQGTMSADYSVPVPSDDADSFAFTVPDGVFVTNVALVISNYSATDGAFARERTFSGGTATYFISSDTTFTNLISTGDGKLASGEHNLQVHGISGGEPPVETGTVSFSWIFTFTVENQTPTEAASWGELKHRYRSR